MIFKASRASAIEKLNNFVENNLSDYSKQRNFDYGPEKRSNVSCLSPYISHGVINELELIDKSLKKFSTRVDGYHIDKHCNRCWN